MIARLARRIEARVTVDRDTGCWVWPGALGGGSRTRGRYGQIWCQALRRPLYTHRVILESIQALPEGHEVDHLCLNTRCCNPDHLEAVTPQENKRRRDLDARVPF